MTFKLLMLILSISLVVGIGFILIICFFRDKNLEKRLKEEEEEDNE